MSIHGQFPAELIQRSQWCLWKIEPDKKGRLTKVPYRPDGRKAASNDPRTWSAFSAVSDVLVRKPGLFGGAGFFFAADDTLCGVDLDVSLDADGNPQPWAADIIARFQDTYRERSVSGHGLHIVCRAQLPGKGRNFNVPDRPTDAGGKNAQIGLSDRARFFALTGQRYQESTLEIADHQQSIEWLLTLMDRKHWTKPPQSKEVRRELTDSEIIEHARKAKKGAKFTRLWAGEWKFDYGSQSEADLGLCCMLTFWCGPNPSRIDALFRHSSLARHKWLEREDYRERTIHAAIAKTTEFYNERKRREPSTADMPRRTETAIDLPEIFVGARQLPEITGEALAALQAANHPPELFARSGRMVAVLRDERNRHVIAEVSESALRGRMARSGFYFKLSKDGDRIECAPPLHVVKDLQALSAAEWSFPALDALVEAPCLRPDGTVCNRPGYDSSTCLYYAPSPGLSVPEIPDAPMIDDVHAALDLLDSAIGEFPFADDASRANALASLLTPLLRPAINSPTPLALYDAPQAGTGKTLLAEVVAIISTGRPAETFSAPKDPEEWRKKITTALASGRSVVVIDNIIHRLDSDALCMALTTMTYSDRLFRTFEPIVLPVKCTWIATGNNIQLGGDMPRRCYWIRLDAKQSRPFKRTGFRHADLRAWVKEQRGNLIAALLTLARYWYNQGPSNPKRVKPLGSFEAWSNTIGGILESAGVEGFLANVDSMVDQADSEAVQWEAFLLELADAFGGEPFRVTDVVERLQVTAPTGPHIDAKRLRKALPDFLAEATDRIVGFFQRRLGNCFAQRIGRRFGESQVFLERADPDRKTKVQCWRVVKPHGGVTNPAEEV